MAVPRCCVKVRKINSQKMSMYTPLAFVYRPYCYFRIRSHNSSQASDYEPMTQPMMHLPRRVRFADNRGERRARAHRHVEVRVILLVLSCCHLM
jgi:hypothetical protein